MAGYLNANDWMSKTVTAASASGPFSNANQWATSFGGPIIKNKTFFFVDYEGMRFLLPNVDQVTSPTPAFIAAAEAQVGDYSIRLSQPTYNKLLSSVAECARLCSAAVNPSKINRVTTGGFLLSLVLRPVNGFDERHPVFADLHQPFRKRWHGNTFSAFRVDQKLGNNDNIFGRYKLDHGLQPTHLDPINSRVRCEFVAAELGLAGSGNPRVWANQDQLVHRDTQPLRCAVRRSDRSRDVQLCTGVQHGLGHLQLHES